MLPDHFMAKVQVDDSSGCWIWTASLDRYGYGQFWWAKKVGNAHRFVMETLHGPIAKGIVVDHICRNRRCVNPEHLRLITFAENVLIGESFSAVNARRTHCTHGHPFDDLNTYIRPDGSRDCRTCIRQRVAAYQRRKAA